MDSLAGFHCLPEVDEAGLEGDFTAGTEAPARRRRHPVRGGSLAFTTAPWAFLIGSRPCPASSSETYRFARSKLLGDGPKAVPRDWTPLMGFIESLLHRHGCLCVHSRPGRRLDIGPELPRSEHVPFLPFLPAPTVSSAEARPEDRTLDSSRVCCTPQPVLEFATFPTSRPLGRPRPEGCCEIFPSGEDPSKLSPLRQPSSASPLPPSSRRGSTFTARAFPLVVLASHRRRVTTTAGHPIRPQGFRPPKSPLHPRSVATSRSSMLPWALDRTRSVPAAAVSCAPGASPISPCGVQDRGRRPPTRERGRRQRFSALSGSEGADACIRPEGRRAPVQLLAARRLLRFWSARRLRAPYRGGATGSVEGVGPIFGRIRRVSRHPPHRVPKDRWAPMKTRGTRRIAAARPKRLPPPVRFTRRCSVSGHRGHAPKGASRPGAPPGEQAHGRAPVVRASASGQRHPKAPRPGPRGSTPTSLTRPSPKRRLLHRSEGVGRRCATRPRRPEGHRVEPTRAPPEGIVRRRSRTRRCGTRGSGASPASWRVPASGQTDIVSIQERSGSVRRPEPPGDPKAAWPTLARRERGGSAQPTRISGWSPSRTTEVGRAEPDRSPIQQVLF